ncbi:MAG: CHRD domain-containing protein [Saprospiraceae bacterium]|nr:CHRD domain-containing protein [Saprospiraceae bacterium]
MTLAHADSFTDGVCGGPSGTVIRQWTATDAYGNSVTCQQTITIERPDLDDVDLPLDVQWTCEQYDAFPNIIEAEHLHAYITDTDPTTDIINVNLDPNCDDLDLNLGTPNTQDNPAINTTNYANGGLGGLSGAISGSQEVPPTASPGSGSISGNTVNGFLNITVSYANLGGVSTAAHIHTGAAGANGPVTFDLGALGFPLGVNAGSFTASIPVTQAQRATLLAGGMYVNIHNAAFPGGAIRGQIAVTALGCPGSNPFSNPPSNGLDDADVLALTGSGVPTVNGLPLKALCEITCDWEDLVLNVCPGTFKIIRRWTCVDWCADPVDVRHYDQLIKVVDDEAPQADLFAVAGESTSNYGTHDIPALGNGGGCNQEPQLSGGTQYLAHVQLPGSFTPQSFNNVELDKVWVEVDHAKVSDLAIFLRSPAGFVVELTSNNGGNGTSIAADFYDAAPGNVTLSQFNTIGSFKPEGSSEISCGGFAGNITTIAGFNDPSLAWQNEVLGNWELIVFDEFAQATGKLVSWKLFFKYSSINIDVYDASVPQNGGAPHAVCEGTVVVPPIDAYDNCSGVAGYSTELWTIVPGSNPALTMNLLGTVNGNGGAFYNIPLFANGANARYIVRYYVVDGCGNQTYVETVVTLRDKVPPVPICVEYTEISITNDGQNTGTSCSRLYAEDLDKASYDNCKPVYFLMAKMSDATSPNIFNRCYYPYRDFCCEDLLENGGHINVILLVLDQDPTPFFSTLNSAPLGCDGTPGLFLSQNFAFNTSGLNFNTCMVDVQVTDKLPPVLVSCPPNQRISCDWYADNLETQLATLTTAQQRCDLLTSLGFGAPTYYDNCATNTTCNFSSNLDQCLEGTITRSWTTTDNAGNTALQPCTQTINVDHVSDWAVQFPLDINVNCGANVPGFGEPEIFYETCELIAVSHDDQLFQVQGTDACYKIVRQWTVINWCVVGTEVDQEVVEQPENALGLSFPQCDVDSDGDCDARTFRDSWRGTNPYANLPQAQYPFGNQAYRLRPTVIDANQQRNPDLDLDSDPWDGYITFQQVIKVQDLVNPVFTNGCTIPDVCIEDNTCGATLLLPVPEITECTDQYTVTVQIFIGGVWLNGFGPYLNVAPGTYQVRYVAQDYCNNQTECLTTVTVKDCKKPTPYCKNGLVVELMVPSGMVDIWASDFDAGSFDNCPGALKLSFSANVNDIGNTYTCDDLGQQPVQIWVTDAAGNQDYCETFVIIQANMGQCDDDPLVAGTIANEGNLGVENVSVNINSPSGFNSDLATNAAGFYGVNVDDGGDYTITPQYDQEPLNGVSTFDLVLISKHILGVAPLGSPYKVIAADANKSNSVTTFDLVEIRKLILFINSDFPNNTSWRFFDANCSFANPANPFAGMCQEVINLNNVTADQIANDFVAVKIGDVNGSAAVNLLGSTEDRTMVGDLVFNADDVNVEAGNTYTVEFKATDFNVSGYQFSLSFDRKSLEFVEVVSGVADASNFGTTMANEGVLTASWNSDEAKRLATGEVVFGLTFKALQGGRMSELVNINSSYTVAEAYNGSNELMDVAMSFNNNLVSGAFDLYQNTPNPFASVTTIGFYLPEATSATLTVSDVQGKVVKVIKGDYSKGYNTVKLNRSDVGANGVLSYRLDTDSDSATRKMILVD